MTTTTHWFVQLPPDKKKIVLHALQLARSELQEAYLLTEAVAVADVATHLMHDEALFQQELETVLVRPAKPVVP